MALIVDGCSSNAAEPVDHSTGFETIAPTTAVTTTAVTTTTIDITVPPTSMVAASTSVALPVPSADALADWPIPPTEVPDLAEVPMLLPTVAVPGATSATRIEGADDVPSFDSYSQFWFGEGPGAAVMNVETNIDQTPTVNGEGISLPPWDRALFVSMTDGYTNLWLEDSSGSVNIWAHGLSRDDVTKVASSLARRTDGQPGWDVGQLPTGLTPTHEGWSLGAASRSVGWAGDDGIIAELWIAHGVPSVFTSPWFEGSTPRLFDINGSTAVVLELDGRTAVVWSPEPDVTVRFGLYGTLDDAVEIARSIRKVDDAVWKQDTTPDTSGVDGCNSMFC